MALEIPFFIHGKLADEHIIWLQDSNRYIHLQEPAWLMLEAVFEEQGSESCYSKISEMFAITRQEAEMLIQKLLAQLNELNFPEQEPQVQLSAKSEELDEYLPEYYAEMTYRIGDKVFQFKYESVFYEYYIHPLFSSFEIPKGENHPMCTYELFEAQGRVYLRKNGVLLGNWALNESHLLKGKIFLELLELLHGKKEDEWMAAVHASAIADGRHTILFSAQSGSGKTTFSSLLRANGFKLISDDFVPIDRETACAFPFPTGVSVKEGALPLLLPHFPDLESAESIRYEQLNKTVRFAKPEDYASIGNMKLPVRAIIFVSYTAGSKLVFEEVDKITALNTIFEEAWMEPNHLNAKAFLDWFDKIPCYRLTYSDNEKAIQQIRELFEQ